MKCPACGFENENPNRYKYTPTTIDKLKLFDERDILCCKNCSFGMIEKDVDEEVLQRYYSSDYSGKARKQVETKTTTINTDNRTSYSFDFRSVSQLALIKQYFDIQPKATVVEIGAGTGGFLFSLRQMKFSGKYVAFEPQEQAHKCLAQLGSDVEKDVFDLQGAVKYKDSVDLVVMSHSLEHFNPGKISEILNAVRVMLRKGGVFFCEVPNANLPIYPNAGERVVPHLSFFSIDSLRGFIGKSGMDLVFINACGNSQLKKNESQKINELDRKGHFIFDLDVENEILRNRKYHQYLENEGISQRKRQKFLNIAIKLLGRKSVMSLLNLMRRYRQKPHSSLIGSNYFSYGANREFLRLIALK